MRTLPPGWAWARFDEVATVRPNLVDPAHFLDFPHIAPNHIEGRTGRLLPYDTVRVDGVTSSKHRFLPGQILYSKIRPYLAKAVAVDFEGLCSADMYPITTVLDRSYLLHWLLSPEFTEAAAGEQGRSVLPKINRHSLGKLPVPVPPLPEQKRIVATLNAILDHIAVGGSSLHRASVRALCLSQQMIDSAWDETWPTEKLSGLLAQPLANGRSVPTADSGFPVLRLTALKDRRIDLTERKMGSWDEAAARPFQVARDDFLISRGNGSLRLVGRGGLVESAPDPVAYPDTLIRVRLNPDKFHAPFLALVWDSTAVRRKIESLARTTAGIYKVNQAMLREIELPTPDIEDQITTATRVNEHLASCERLQDEIRDGEKRAASLRQSVLSAAFSGRLAPQVQGEEPATSLISRLRGTPPGPLEHQVRKVSHP